jgi:hypothetical protein
MSCVKKHMKFIQEIYSFIYDVWNRDLTNYGQNAYF